MEFNLIRRSLSSGSLVLCSRQSFKLRTIFLLFLSPLVITLQAQTISAANLKPTDYCPSLFLIFKPESTTSAPKRPGNNDSGQSLYQPSFLTDYLLNQANQVRFYRMGSGSIACLPDVSESASAVLGLSNQAPHASPGVPYIILAVNLAFLLCMLPFLSKPVRVNELSEDGLRTIEKIIKRIIYNATAGSSISSNKILVKLEGLLAAQSRQITSLAQEIAAFRQESVAAIKSTLEASNHLEVSRSPSSEVSLDHVSPSDGDSAESTDPDNYQYLSIVIAYRNALSRGDRSLLRKIYTQQLVITAESEEALLNPSSSPTRLAAVASGGSYLLVPSIDDIERAWILPDWRTLESFTNNRPNKGIFSYRTEANLSLAELRQPAEVRQVGELWEVVTMGVIAVRG